MSNDFKSVLEVRTEVRSIKYTLSFKDKNISGLIQNAWFFFFKQIFNPFSPVFPAESEAAAQQERAVLPAPRLNFSLDGKQLQ